MTDAHYHRDGYATFLSLGDREFRFFGLHPWQVLDLGEAALLPLQAQYLGEAALLPLQAQHLGEAALLPLREKLSSDPHAGVGEIGLDRLKNRVIDPAQRAVFAAQLEVAAEFLRPVVLHGAKCWGEVVAACRPYAGRIPAFLFHGFSRSGGLLPDIAALNGFVGVGAALLNDHAVNYRALVKEIPLERLLVETDADYGRDKRDPPGQDGRVALVATLTKLAELRGMDVAALEAAVDTNATRFVEVLA